MWGPPLNSVEGERAREPIEELLLRGHSDFNAATQRGREQAVREALLGAAERFRWRRTS